VVKRLFLATFCHAVFCLAAVLPVFSQSYDTQGTGIRFMVRTDGFDDAAMAVSLAGALARSTKLDAILIAPVGVDLLEAAIRASCSVAVYVSSTTLEADGARSDWSILDPLSGRTLAEGTVEGPSPTERDLAEFWWLPVVDAAEAALPLVSGTMVRIEALPGSIVSGLDTKPVKVPETGVVELPLRIPGTYEWRAVADGMYPERGYLVAMEQGVSLVIPHRELRRFAVEMGLYMAQFPDLLLTWRFASDYLFVRAGLTQFLAGLYFVDSSFEEGSPPLYISMPLLQPGFGAGTYFLPSDSTVRPYIASSAFARLLVAKGFPVQLDPIAPLGLSALAGAEWRAMDRAGFFFELGFTVYPCPSGALMAASVFSGADTSGGFNYGADWFLEFPFFRFGARVTL